ncbi:hypothetical protein DRP04_09945 [Archaeoglobales archaeon]|nr:MAG: hypothetical protein DRP04_09945 [Archaeoglobales archaeon]
MRILVIAPLDSAPTTVTFYAARRIYETLRSKGYNVDMLPHVFATHFSFLLREFFSRDDAVIYLGHGTSIGLIGQLPVGLLKMLVDISTKNLVKDKVVITIACNTLRRFGREAPCRAYFGSDYFMSVGYPTLDHNYTEDFVDTWETLILNALEKDPYRALDLYRDRCTYYIRLYEAHRWEAWDVYSYAMRINRDYYGVVVR